MARCVAAIAGAAALWTSAAAFADEVGRVGVDWSGNDVVVEAVRDEEVGGVTCHVAYFDRGLIDRLSNGNWFEDPSNSAIACRQTGPIDLSSVRGGSRGEDVFSTSRSIVFKSLRVKRIYDEDNQTLIYVAHGRELARGSAKVSIATVPLFGTGSDTALLDR